MEKDKETQWQNFKQMVAGMTDDKFYEECVSCRMISFGSCEGDDKDYFFDLVNAYSENKYKAKEEVNEEELDELALKENPNSEHSGDTYESGLFYGFDDGFKAGVRYMKNKGGK